MTDDDGKATCAYVGCLEPIAYDPSEERRSRYCPEHEFLVAKRLGLSGVSDSTLFVRLRPAMEVSPRPPRVQYIMLCHICKTRTMIAACDFKTDMVCLTQDCPGIRVYHDEAKIK
jgi:hypothetical protein